MHCSKMIYLPKKKPFSIKDYRKKTKISRVNQLFKKKKTVLVNQFQLAGFCSLPCPIFFVDGHLYWMFIHASEK